MSAAPAPAPLRSRSRRPDVPHGRIFNHEMYELAIGTVYVGLMTNLLVVTACLPLVVMLVTTDPAASWPVLALLSPLVAPAVSAAFAVFRGYTVDGSTAVVRTFWRGWRGALGRPLAIGALLTVVATIAGMNLTYLWTTTRLGAAFIPVQVVLLLLAGTTALVALVLRGERPDLGLVALLRAGLWLGLRRWYLSAVALIVLGMLAALVVEQPAIALGVALAPLLYAAWGTCRFAVRPLLEE